VGSVAVSGSRLRALFDAGTAVTAELTLDAVLQRLVEAAADLTGARYVALGVIASDGRTLERFLTHGISVETRATIGSLPRGLGILGALIDDAVPLRLNDLAEDPRSVGFPPGHPPMKTFLGVPIVLRGIAYGNLYLTEKSGGEEFTAEDEELIGLLAVQAGVAIENARLYEASRRWSQQLRSLIEVGNALASELDQTRLLDLVTRRLRELLDARLVAVVLPAADGDLEIVAAAGDGSAGVVGERIRRAGSMSGRVLERARSERIDSVIDDPEVNQELVRRLGVRSGLWVPLVAHDRPLGVLEVHDKLTSPDGRFSDDDVRMAETFASRAAVAVDLSSRVSRDALRRVVDAQERERLRIARELHDETGQALTSILLGLRPLEEALAEHPAHADVLELRELVVTALHDVRRLAVEVRPKVLDDFGLVPALTRLAESFAQRAGIDVQFSATLDERLPHEVESTLYRVVQEALTNVAKHADAAHVSVVVARRDRSVAAVIEDDGRGFSGVEGDGVGLVGMRERLALLDGVLEVQSHEGAGTTVAAEVPLQ
jgi:signal transduction histidine kinase